MQETQAHANLQGAGPQTLAERMVSILDRKKAEKLELYLVRDVTIIADYYVIGTGRSSTHVKALADELLYEMSLHQVNADRVEGREGASWILLDFGSALVHLFDSASRDYYRLERLLGAELQVGIHHLLQDIQTNNARETEEKES
ncbi:MAG: ribosome silencing factor [Eubacteriales bacterium]